MIRIDRDKAEEIVKNKIREWREPRFKPLDIEFMQALEGSAPDGYVIQDVTNQKEALRRLPKEAEGKSVDELRKLYAKYNIG